MQVHRNCVVCILNQLLRASDYMQLEETQINTILMRALKKAGDIYFPDYTAPEYAEKLYDIITEVTGIADPYRPLRFDQNHMVMDHLPTFRKKIETSPDPLLTAGYFSLLGNIIDYGGVHIFDTTEIFDKCDHIQIGINNFPEFKAQLSTAKSLLILSDNAGEAVFDMLFIEEIKHFNPNVKVFYGVRSKPAINDIIKEDALYIGIDRTAEVIETGATYAGTVIPRTTDQFKNIYHKADIIISKGQGNFETLENQPENILFIFKIKCPTVAEYTHIPLNTLVFAFKDSIRQAKH